MNKSFIFGIASTLAVVALAGGGYWLGQSSVKDDGSKSSSMVQSAEAASVAEVGVEVAEIKPLKTASLGVPTAQRMFTDLFDKEALSDLKGDSVDLDTPDYKGATFWVGHSFSADGQRYYVALVRVYFQANVDPMTVRMLHIVYKQQKDNWVLVDKSDIQRHQYLLEVYKRYGNANLHETRKPEFFTLKEHKVLFTLPTQDNEESLGVLSDYDFVVVFNTHSQQLSFAGEIKRAENNQQQCEVENTPTSCYAYTSKLVLMPQYIDGLPIIRVERKGTDMSFGGGAIGTKQLTAADFFEYHYAKGRANSYYEINSD